MTNKEETVWDVAVIGGGPAGLMAAGRAGENGSRVILLEKNSILGKKLLITGGGRCNMTNAEMDIRKLLEKFEEAGKFLFSTFSQFSSKETLEFFNTRGLQTKVEPGLRVFPITDKSQSVLDVLEKYIQDNNVTIQCNSAVSGFKTSENKIISATLEDGREIKAKNFILATGGKSRPETGSTGEGFSWLRKIGHTIIEPSSALVPIAILDEWVKKLQGLSLSDVKISLVQYEKKVEAKKGKMLFTHFGISGPTILNMSKHVGDLLKHDDVTISIDLFPQYGLDKMNTELQELFKKQNKKQLKNCLPDIIPSTLVPVILELTDINPKTPANSVTREDRIKLMEILKSLNMKVKGLLGVENAIVSSGGVSLDEVDFKTMSSRLFPNLYLVGDILNVNRPSGGFSLQLCWTTGFVAGTSASKNNN